LLAFAVPHLLREADDLVRRCRMDRHVTQALQCRVCGTHGVELRQQRGDSRGVTQAVVARLELVLFVVDLLLGTRARNVLRELIPGVDTPRRSAGGSENSADSEG